MYNCRCPTSTTSTDSIKDKNLTKNSLCLKLKSVLKQKEEEMNKRLIVSLIVCIILFMGVVSFGSFDDLSRVRLSPKTNKALVIDGLFNGGGMPTVFLKTLDELLSFSSYCPKFFVALETATSFTKGDGIDRSWYTGNVIYFTPYHGILLIYIDKDALKEAIDSFVAIYFLRDVEYKWDGEYVYFDLAPFFPSYR